MIYGKDGDVAMECESLTFRGEVLTALFNPDLDFALQGESGKIQLQASYGGFDPLPHQEDQDTACRLKVHKFLLGVKASTFSQVYC